jgi:hypothetical protein
VGAEQVGGPFGPGGRYPQGLERLDPGHEAALEGLALHLVRTAAQEVIGVAAVPGPGDDLEVGEGLVRGLHQFGRRVGVVDGD